MYPQSGGTYEYGYRLLNPAMGFSAGWMFLLSKLSAAGIVAIGFGSYFHQLVPLFPPLVYSVSAILLLTIANLPGIKKAGIVNVVIVLITLLWTPQRFARLFRKNTSFHLRTSPGDSFHKWSYSGHVRFFAPGGYRFRRHFAGSGLWR